MLKLATGFMFEIVDLIRDNILLLTVNKMIANPITEVKWIMKLKNVRNDCKNIVHA